MRNKENHLGSFCFPTPRDVGFFAIIFNSKNLMSEESLSKALVSSWKMETTGRERRPQWVECSF
ncbi:hypothetical protein AKJ65_05120 [candidate division MSBL1 archaeon SCGC-AAA259E19]|uniref:Uncharacterized protein n=1 Tax=candidate division MSBL1 archaeon SCGC-AAA259E19 TaxID=1698264 RepID=A0A133UJ09_9EURY|nr:hypothetical protein AKJ65_05120 [candidate division MSBL1 archaeon SCGC-AAA259E19]